MANKVGFFSILLIGLSACVISNKCPSSEDVPDCECYKTFRDTLQTFCRGYYTGRTIEDYIEILRKDFAAINMEFVFHNFNKESRLPSRVFEGFHVKGLEFSHNNVTRWADEEGGPAFVGLEDTLEKIEFRQTIIKEDRDDLYYKNVTDPMSLGHLRKLKEVDFIFNELHKFSNEWFGEGGNSVEIITLNLNRIYEIGDKAFAGLTQLKKLDLGINRISTLTRSILPNPAEKLEKIILWGNKIKSLPEDMFTNMPSLRSIELSGNDIQLLPENTWKPIWSRLLYFNFADNPLKCDDHIEWTFKVEQPEHLDARCRYPEEMKGKHLRDIIDEKQGIKRE